MSANLLKELHKKIDKVKGKKEDKKLLHQKLEENKDDTTGLAELEEILDQLIESKQEMPSPPNDKEETIIKKAKSPKADIVFKAESMPDNCYMEIDPEGQEKCIQLPSEKTKNPIRIRQIGKNGGSLVVRCSEGGFPLHKIDATKPGYKFTDFQYGSGGFWIPSDKFGQA